MRGTLKNEESKIGIKIAQHNYQFFGKVTSITLS